MIHRQFVVLGRHHVTDQLGDRPRNFGSRGAGSDDHEVQGALVHEGGIPVGIFEDRQDPRPQPLRILEGVQREQVLRAGRVEEVRLAPGGENEEVPGGRLGTGERHGLRLGVGGRDLAELHADARVLPEQLTDVHRHIGGRELIRRHLVQERQELVVVVLVDQGDMHVVVVLRELFRAADPGEPGAHDHHFCWCAHARSPPSVLLAIPQAPVHWRHALAPMTGHPLADRPAGIGRQLVPQRPDMPRR